MRTKNILFNVSKYKYSWLLHPCMPLPKYFQKKKKNCTHFKKWPLDSDSDLPSSKMEGKTILNTLPYIHYITRGFINLFSRRATGFHRQTKLLELNFLCKKNVPLLVKLAGENCPHSLAVNLPGCPALITLCICCLCNYIMLHFLEITRGKIIRVTRLL